MLNVLPDAPGARDPEPFADGDHPMRRITREAAADAGWHPERAARITDLFDGMASDWSEEHVDPTKAAPVRDALDRGRVPLDGEWIELGSGTGAGARVLEGRVGSLVCTDLSFEMLRHAPDLAPRVRADATSLPFADDRFDAALLINMLLFPTELLRVLRPSGTVVWVNTLGDQTPIHLSIDDVADALTAVDGLARTGFTARAGTGFWATFTAA
ncbi:MAG: class I SAM-dependent methyltransferase [Actinomycetota bacterium]